MENDINLRSNFIWIREPHYIYTRFFLSFIYLSENINVVVLQMDFLKCEIKIIKTKCNQIPFLWQHMHSSSRRDVSVYTERKVMVEHFFNSLYLLWFIWVVFSSFVAWICLLMWLKINFYFYYVFVWVVCPSSTFCLK